MMNSFSKLALAFAATIALLVSSNAYAVTHEEVADAAMAQMDRMANAVLTITDKATAEKAVLELMSVTEELKKIATGAKGLGEPSKETKDRIMAKMKVKQEEIQTKMKTVPAQIKKAGAEAATVLAKGMEGFGAAMQEVDKAFKEADKK